MVDADALIDPDVQEIIMPDHIIVAWGVHNKVRGKQKIGEKSERSAPHDNP